MSELSVLHVAPIHNALISGLTFAIPPMVQALNERGIPSALLTTAKKCEFGAKTSFPTFWYHSFARGTVLDNLPKLFSSPSLIVFHSTYIPAHFWLSLEARKKNIPYIIMPHGGMTKGALKVKAWKKRVGNLLFFNKLVKGAQALHCLTQRELTDVQEWKKPVFQVGNGVYLPSVETLKKRESSKTLRFLFLGRLDPHHKGLDLLLEACARVAPKLKEADVSFRLYGNEVQGSRAVLENRIDEFGLQQLIRICDPVKGQEKEQAFLDADIFLHTSRFEGHPVAVLEGLSYGLPCLLSPGTNMAEEVEASCAGWNTREDISATLLQALGDRSRLGEMGKNARELCEEKYSWRSVGEQLENEYRQVLKA